MNGVDLRIGDCRDVMAMIDTNSVDAIVCDPPYEIGFVGKSWDKSGIAYNEYVWQNALRVLKPGGHLLAFGGSRTYHRLAVAIEDAGFEIRDQLQWIYGSGFPKSLDVSKALDKAAGAEREVVGVKPGHEQFAGRTTTGHIDFKDGTEGFDRPWMHKDEARERYHMATAPATDLSRQWDGWGTALKPAHESIVLARKPFSERTVAANVTQHGTGALNIDGCRIATDDRLSQGSRKPGGNFNDDAYEWAGMPGEQSPLGRWPANVVLDEEAGALLDAQSGTSQSPNKPVRQGGYNSSGFDVGRDAGTEREGYGIGYGDTGGASRFFLNVPIDDPDTLRFCYCPKASRRERNAGLDGMPERANRINAPRENEAAKFAASKPNHHPTVKPISLMRWLVRIVTPPGGVVLDPFMGSGTTGIAAVLEGIKFVGIEIDPEYIEIAERRIAHWSNQ